MMMDVSNMKELSDKKMYDLEKKVGSLDETSRKLYYVAFQNGFAVCLKMVRQDLEKINKERARTG